MLTPTQYLPLGRFGRRKAAFFTRRTRIASRTAGPMAERLQDGGPGPAGTGRNRPLADSTWRLAGTSTSVNGSWTVRNRRTYSLRDYGSSLTAGVVSFFPGYRCGTTLINDFIRVCRDSTRHQCASGPSSFPPELGPFFVSVMQVFSDYDCSGRPSGGSGTDFPSLTAMTMTSICFSSERRTSRSRKRGGRCAPVWC